MQATAAMLPASTTSTSVRLFRPRANAGSTCCLRPTTIRAVAICRGVAPGLASLSSFMGARLAGAPSGASSQRVSRPKVGEHCKTRVQRATASFFGVGAPEALLVAVVALVVFGPKGLADAAASLGKTLRAFQPTVRELADISNELQSTLKKEIGLDEMQQEMRRPPTPTPGPTAEEAKEQPMGSPLLDTARQLKAEEAARTGAAGGGTAAASTSSTAAASSALAGAQQELVAVTDEIAKQLDPQIETKRAAAEQAAWGGAPPVPTTTSSSGGGSSSVGAEGGAGGAAAAGAAGAGAAGASLDGLSIDELEKELARRKGAKQQQQQG